MPGAKTYVRKFIPQPLLSAYHFLLAFLGALIYRFPSRKLVVIGITGTNGKSSTAEFLNAIFEEAGIKTALSNSIRVKIDSYSEASTGRSMPGRFFIQRFLRRALDRGCRVAIIEMTSEGVKQHRHRGIAMNALVFTNLAPEHIESHGSLQAYADAKFKLGRALARSPKRPRIMVANADDPEATRYLALPVEKAIGFGLTGEQLWSANERGGSFRFDGIDIPVNLGGKFYIQNALAAAEVARAFGIFTPTIRSGIARVKNIPGRMESINEGQAFSVIIDYALTPDALEALYKTYGDRKKICIFGSAGGGRDVWKRPVLGKLAETYCETVILTNDIAYDESPQHIIDDIARGMGTKPEIVLDRRSAIRRGFEIAQKHAARKDVAVLITGMGVDAEISAPDGTKVPWNETKVVTEELRRVTMGHV